MYYTWTMAYNSKKSFTYQVRCLKESLTSSTSSMQMTQENVSDCPYGWRYSKQCDVCVPFWVVLVFHLMVISTLGWICVCLRELLLCFCRWWHRSGEYDQIVLELEDRDYTQLSHGSDTGTATEWAVCILLISQQGTPLLAQKGKMSWMCQGLLRVHVRCVWHVRHVFI